MQKILLGSIALDTKTHTVVTSQDSKAKRPWTQEKHHHPGTPGGKASDREQQGTHDSGDTSSDEEVVDCGGVDSR